MPDLAGAVVESSNLNPLPFPGRIIKRNEPDATIVRAVKEGRVLFANDS